jgi:hypothetical protein
MEPNEKPDKPAGWKFSRTVVIDTLIGLAVAIIAIVWFASSLEKRLSMMEDRVREQARERDDSARAKRIEQIEQALREQQKLIEQLVPRK